MKKTRIALTFTECDLLFEAIDMLIDAYPAGHPQLEALEKLQNKICDRSASLVREPAPSLQTASREK